jgi:hypothetical protein
VAADPVTHPADWPVAPSRAFDAAHLAAAVEAQRGLAPGLAALRAVPLPFLADAPEPGHATRWLAAPGAGDPA